MHGATCNTQSLATTASKPGKNATFYPRRKRSAHSYSQYSLNKVFTSCELCTTVIVWNLI